MEPPRMRWYIKGSDRILQYWVPNYLVNEELDRRNAIPVRPRTPTSRAAEHDVQCEDGAWITVENAYAPTKE